MQYCPNCGTPCEDNALFCENCGTDLREDTVLQEEPREVYQQELKQKTIRQEERTPKSKNDKNMIPLIAGTVVLVAVIIAGTILGVQMIRNKSEKQDQQTAASNLSDTDETEKNQMADEDDNTADEDKAVVSGAEDKELKPTIAPLEEEPDANLESSDASAAKNEEEEPDATGDSSEKTADTELKPTIPPMEEEPESETQSGYETYYVVNCKESITLRKSASTKAGEYCQIPLGAAVSFVETAENGFYKIIYNGTTGYALASYLSPQQAQGSDGSGNGSRMVVVNCKESITLRKTPSTKGEEFCQIPLGAEVEYLGTAENGFYTVKYNGTTGYALASYLAWAS